MTNTIGTRHSAIEEYLCNCDESALVELWDFMCEKNNDPDSEIFDFSDPEEFFNEYFCGCKPYEIASATQSKHFDMSDRWAQFTIYGVKTYPYISNHYGVYLSDLARDIDDNPDEYAYANESFSDDILEIVEKFEEEEEEEDSANV